MTNVLFNRAAKLTITKKKPGEFFGPGKNSLVVTDLRLAFDTFADLNPEPNKSIVTVYNLPADTRAGIESKPIQIRLDAGYKDNLFLIFQGDVTFSSHEYASPDWKTKIELGDGARAFKHAKQFKSFKPGTSKLDIIKDTAKSMGLKVPNSFEDVKEIAGDVVNGFSSGGKSSRTMSGLLAGTNLSWSIQNNKLQIIGKNKTNSIRAQLISEKTGMIGSPAFGAPRYSKGPPVFRIKTLLNPSVTPGGLIRVESKLTTGDFKVLTVKHAGDTWTQNWYSEIEARRL